jgi:hypothetical protein
MRNRFALLSLAVIITLGASIAAAQEVKGFRVSGKVLRPDGSPAVGAAVEAREHVNGVGWRPQATVTVGADGAFALELKQGDYLLCALLDDLIYQNWINAPRAAKDGADSGKFVIHLDKGCRLQGTATDKTTGQPVADMRIATREGDHAQSSASGAWSMVVPKGSITLTAAKDGYWSPTVICGATEDIAKVRIETKPGAVVKGRVLDEQGKPIAGASVGTEVSSMLSVLAKTDADGKFSLGGQDPDGKAVLWAEADGYDTLYSRAVTFAAGGREAQAELTLKKLKYRSISGSVKGPDGAPAKGAKVAYGSGPDHSDRVVAWADKDGKYTISKAHTEASLVMATCTNMAPSCKPVEADKDAQLDFQLKSGHSVEIAVEDEKGNPILDAGGAAAMKIFTDPRDPNKLYPVAYATSDKKGILKFDNLPAGEVFVNVTADHFAYIENERFKVDRKDYTLVMRKEVTGQICGTVLKAADDKPVAEFNVRLDFSRAARSNGVSPGLIEQGVNFQAVDGRFVIKGLDVNTGFRVVVTAPGYMQGDADPVMVTPVGQYTYKNTIIKLRPASSFEGAVAASDTDAPIEGVMVTAWDTPGTSGSYHWDMDHMSCRSVSTHTDASGKFKFDSMPFAYGMVMLEKPSYARTMLKAVNFRQPMQAKMDKGATVTGSIADAQGKAPQGEWLNLMHKGLFVDFCSSASSIQPDGSFTVDDLPAGSYFVGCYKDSKPIMKQVFELKAGETYHVDWDKQGPVRVQGKVTQHGRPVPKAEINVNSNGPGYNWEGAAETADDGSYELSLSQPETFFFSCSLGEWKDPNHISTGKTLQLSNGKNEVDFSLPCGLISGKLVDAAGKPLPSASLKLYVRETWKQNRGRDSILFAEAEGRWWAGASCKTDKNGVFRARSLKAGKWMICVAPGSAPAAIFTLADGEAKAGVVVREPKTGSARISVTGMKALPKGVWVTCTDRYGQVYYPKRTNETWTMDFAELPVGKLRAMIHSLDYLPTTTEFEVRPGATATAHIKLIKGSKIVFKPANDDDSGPVSIGVKLTTLDGKPVIMSTEGLVWATVLTHDSGHGGIAAITVKPGKYRVSAGAVRGDSRNYGDDPKLTGFSGVVAVASGKDTVVRVPLSK